MMERRDYPVLIVLEGETAGQRWVLREESVLLGRGADCDIIFPERQISRHHARIERTPDGRYLLYDLGSKNGTFVNGEEVREVARELRDGDEIQLAFCVRMSFVGSEATVPLAGEGPVRGLRVDRAGRRVFIGGRELTPPLSPSQYRFLVALLDARGQVVPREEIIRAVWPGEDPGGISDQAIDALVRRLRARLAELDPAHEYIVTVRGHGFRLENRP